ncbi:DNA glycosylase [Amylostereum chailletii]|nr:DNA glycosylase [Amylostereum chailletii]
MTRGTKRVREATPPSNAASSASNLSPVSPLSPLSSGSSSSVLRSLHSPPQSPHKSKKLKLLTDHADASPFPDFVAPTPAEARAVHAVLLCAHPQHQAAATRGPVDDKGRIQKNSAETCGRVPNVLDALIGTILSQNTSSRNSTAAKHSLDATFGLHGFEAMARAPRAEVVTAIQHGGLANRKAEIIQKLLKGVHAQRGVYSLQHLAEDKSITDAQAMAELVGYDGVGPKTAACVLLFSLGRDSSIAVDTHVYRLSKILAWVPPRANRVQAQLHLDARVPKELKYGLHVLMVTHGRLCKGCKGASAKGSCGLKAYMKERKADLAKVGSQVALEEES